ncbi:MAG TPA: metallophosphoesterase family protein [Candidatus Sulfotelmatobacter sp.]|nr:metallophosphoesterase family protein [Candidatus Sulfotelmatobacter sp.]
MRIAIVSDIHGNLTALEAVIADLRLTSPDLILHGGDLAYGGARPAEVVDRIRDLEWAGVCGNTDEALWAPEKLRDFAARAPKLQKLLATIEEVIPVTCAWLGEERIGWMKTQPIVQRRGPVALVHASPNDVWRGPMPDASHAELSEVFACLEAPIAVYGHIHQPYIRNLPGMTVANTGSVSLSYDGDVRASYLVVDGEKPAIRRVEYDIENEAEALLQSGLPHAEWICRTLRAGRFVPLP